jgi:hypothetical protein
MPQTPLPKRRFLPIQCRRAVVPLRMVNTDTMAGLPSDVAPLTVAGGAWRGDHAGPRGQPLAIGPDADQGKAPDGPVGGLGGVVPLATGAARSAPRAGARSDG